MLSGRCLMFALVATVCCDAGKSTTRSFTVRAAASDSRQEQVVALTGVKMPADVIGFRVYINPPADKALSTESGSYAGSMYASHREPGGEAAGDFVIRLDKRVSGEARVVVEPISSTGNPAGEISVGKVEIKPASKVRGAIEEER